MELTTKHVVALVVGFVFLVAVGILLFSDSSEEQQEPVFRVVTSPTSVTSTNDASDNASTTTAEQTARINEEELPGRVAGFVNAYYSIELDDTSQSRRERTELFVYNEQVLIYLDFGLGDGSAANKARLANELTVRGKPVSEDLTAKVAFDSPVVRVVTVPVEVSATKPDGSVVNRFEIQTVSRWYYESGKWYLLAFKSGGDTE